VENLIETTREGTAPLRRYYELRRRMLDLDQFHLYDAFVPLVDTDQRYPYQEAAEHVVASVAPLGEDYRAELRRAIDERWIDVYENDGKRSGAYSAPVHGVHPYVLMNYQDTRTDMFTLAHELGHSMHTVLSHASQPFVYAHYTIFVAEVASTLNEALLLDHLLDRTEDPHERVLLVQHAIDSIASTFYTQVLFADFELRAHREVEAERPLTADSLEQIYGELMDAYYGDAVEKDPAYRLTWARIPHIYRTPYYVFQYATCFASAATIGRALSEEDPSRREATRERYLELLRSGGSAHPMDQLRRAGVDLGKPDTIAAVITRMDDLVGILERDLDRLSSG
jgi:oligoendopeptidase F